MQRTISMMIGKGTVTHNSRAFHAKNTDPERSHLNVEFCNESIREAYHTLFDEAVQKYNAKQTRSDRMIDDYYEKIRTGKQEKPFKEVILQIGDRDDMSAVSEEGQLAKEMLIQYMGSFQERNPNLYVFSAHLHMDEATPHLHIDFIPYVSGSKRGLETRVSLKQALAAEGFTGGCRSDTEWNQWIRSEKEYLSGIMKERGIEWEQKGTHEQHLSVLEFQKKMRSQELDALNRDISAGKEILQETDQLRDEICNEVDRLETHKSRIVQSIDAAEDKLYTLESQAKDLSRDMSAAQEALKSQSDELEKVSDAVYRGQSELVQLEENKTTVQKQLQSAKAELSRIDSAASERTNMLNVIEKSLSAKTTELKSVSRELDQSKSEVRVLEENKQQLKTEIGKSSAELADLTKAKESGSIEVSAINRELTAKKQELQDVSRKTENAKASIRDIEEELSKIDADMFQYYNPEFRLPEAPAMMSAKTFREKYMVPLIGRLQSGLHTAIAGFHDAVRKMKEMSKDLAKEKQKVHDLARENKYLERQLEKYQEKADAYDLLHDALGENKLTQLLETALQDLEQRKQKQLERQRHRDYER